MCLPPLTLPSDCNGFQRTSSCSAGSCNIKIKHLSAVRRQGTQTRRPRLSASQSNGRENEMLLWMQLQRPSPKNTSAAIFFVLSLINFDVFRWNCSLIYDLCSRLISTFFMNVRTTESAQVILSQKNSHKKIPSETRICSHRSETIFWSTETGKEKLCALSAKSWPPAGTSAAVSLSVAPVARGQIKVSKICMWGISWLRPLECAGWAVPLT